MEDRKDELSDGYISTTESISNQSSTSDILCPPENSTQAQNSNILSTSQSVAMMTSRNQNGDETANFGSTAPSQPGSTSQTAEIKDLLFDFHNKISYKIESSQNEMRSSIISEFKELMTTEVLNPLRTSIEEANSKIDRIEQDHNSKINANANKIDAAKEQLQQQIKSLEERLSQSTAPANSPSRHSFNPALLSRLNNIVISGVDESTNEDLQKKIKDIATAVDCELDAFKAKRIGKKSESNPKPRQILVELGNHWDRKKLYAARSKLTTYTVEENAVSTKPYKKVYFNEDLDKQQASLFYKGRLAKKNGSIKSIWTFGCQVYFAKLGSQAPIALTAESQLPVQANQMAATSNTTAAPGNLNSVVTETNTERPSPDEQVSGHPANQ